MLSSSSEVAKVGSDTCARESALTDSVREPAVEERLIGWAALGEAEVALALERLERAEQHRLAAVAAAGDEEGVERGQRRRANPAVGHEVRIVLAVAVERGQSALQEGH